MTTVLVIDDVSVFRDPVVAALVRAGFAATGVESGARGLASMSRRAPDLVLLDLSMPEMDGMEVLRRMRADPSLRSVPVLVLSVESDRDRIVDAGRLGVRGYVLKSNFSLTELLRRVRSVLGIPTPAAAPAHASDGEQPRSRGALVAQAGAPTPARSTGSPAAGRSAQLNSLASKMGRDQLFALVKKCGELNGLSPAMTQVVKLTGNPNCQSEEVAKAIAHDPAIAVKVLKVANSSVYTRGRPVDSLHKAVVRIGMGGIRQTVLSIGIVDRFQGIAFDRHLDSAQFWEHGIGCGVIAAELAHAAGAKDTDAAFTAGLMHDVGRVVLAEQLAGTYLEVIAEARNLRLPLEQVELRTLSASHADIMEPLLKGWRLPEELIKPVLLHHSSLSQIRASAGGGVREAMRLALADRLSHALLIGGSGNDTIYPTEDLCGALGIDGSAIDGVVKMAQEQTDGIKFAMLSWSSAAAWPSRTAQVRETLPSPFRPLFISPNPAIDAVGVLCKTLADGQDEGPHTLAVVHVPRGAVARDLMGRLADTESALGLPRLPALVVFAAGSAEPEVGAARRARVLTAPFAVGAFVEAALELSEPSEQRRAA